MVRSSSEPLRGLRSWAKAAASKCLPSAGRRFGDVTGEGLLLVPTNGKPVANIVAIPDCNQTPEQLVGLAPGVPSESQYARRLAESGCRVMVPCSSIAR